MTAAIDRERLVALVTALDASETALRRDPPIRGQDDTGDWAVWGRDIRIGMSCHVYPDGDGYLIYFTVAESDRVPSSLPWKNAKAKLSFCQVTQDGDWEGCLRLDRLPAPHEAKAIRDVLGIRKRRTVTGAARSQLEAMREAAKSAKRGSPIDLNRQAA